MKLRTSLVVGRTMEPDALGTARWKDFLNARELSRVYGPHPQSPWMPFHCLTLFVALDYLDHNTVGPYEKDPWSLGLFQLPAWVDSHTMLVVDLAGAQTAALGALLGAAGCDLVCTFNNWPHPQGVIAAETTLAALIRYASWLDEKRTAYPTPAPVAWLCDSERFGTRVGKPGEFDNRYYIEDSVMPGPNFLKAQGVNKIVYISSQPDAVKPDLGVHLLEYQKEGLEVANAVLGNNAAIEGLHPLILPATTFSATGFFRSTAGGFGAPVPHPSSGG